MSDLTQCAETCKSRAQSATNKVGKPDKKNRKITHLEGECLLFCCNYGITN
jgi:hypothetical protein